MSEVGVSENKSKPGQLDLVGRGWTTTLQLADRFRLTLYDAAYLELAHRRSLPLASLDEQLRTAGRTLGVPLLGAAE